LREKTFCPYCGKKTIRKELEGRERSYCPDCDEILYENPFPATVALIKNNREELLLVERAVEPAKGKWGLPGGFVEIDETLEEAVLRELKEETGLTGTTKSLVSVSSQISKYWNKLVIVVGYWVEVSNYNKLTPGDDASDAKFFSLKRLPPLAFSSHQELVNAFLKKEWQ